MRKKQTVNRPKKVKLVSQDIKYVLRYVFGVLFAVVLFFSIGKMRVGAIEDRSKLADPSMITIEVPTRPITKGEQIKKISFSKIQWPINSEISKYALNISPYMEYYASTNLPAYVPISLSSLISNSIDVNAVVENIPAGYRAITVKVDIESVVEGWAQTGNFVDVIVLRQSQDQELGIEAKLIAENVKILAAGATVESLPKGQNSAQAPATVTLLVSQEDALKVRTAATVGKLTFALRGLGDKSPSTSVSMNQKTLLGGPKNGTSKKKEFRGVARGPDGKMYVLDGNSEWVGEINND